MQAVIFGAGGMAKELIDYMESQYTIVCVVSTEPFNNPRYGHKVVERLEPGAYPGAGFYLAVANPAIKRKIVAENEDRWETYVHPSAYVSHYARVGKGCILTPQTLVVGDAQLQDFVFLNTNATVGHDAIVGSYSTLFPNSEVCGDCILGEDCLVGIGGYVLPKVFLPSGTKVSAGAVVRKSIDQATTLYGDPAKPR
jgi:acetyltransferase EpsM